MSWTVTNRSSKRSGWVGNLIFSGFGLFFAFVGSQFVKQEWRNLQETKAMQAWVKTECTIVSSEMMDDGEDFKLEVAYRYEVDGAVFRSTRYGKNPNFTADKVGEVDQARKRLQPGKVFDGYYNPEDPAEAVLNLPTISAARRSVAFTCLFPAFGLLFATIPWLRKRKGREKVAEEKEKSGNAPKIFLMLFGAIFLGAGLLATKALLITPLQKTQAAKSWNATQATVISSKVKSHSDDDGTTYSPYIAYRYEVGGEEYLGDQYTFLSASSSGRAGKVAIVKQYPKGHTFTVFVNPENPAESVIKREASRSLLFGLFPLIFVGVGLAVIIAGFRIKKPKLDSAQAREHIVVLKGTSPVKKAVGIGLFSLFWNGVVYGLSISDAPIFFPLIFGFFGVILLGATIHSILAIFNPRPEVELTPGDIHPGTPVAMRWRMLGRCDQINTLTITLKCLKVTMETTGSRENRTTQTVKTPLHEKELLQTDSQNEIAQGTLQFVVPDDFPASRPGNTNGIQWQIVFHGSIARWPDLKQELPFIVYPSPSDKE